MKATLQVRPWFSFLKLVHSLLALDSWQVNQAQAAAGALAWALFAGNIGFSLPS
jgi:hypothetical protein